MTRKKNAKTEIVVFSIIRDTQCSVCQAALKNGDFLKKEEDKGLCLSCAELNHLVYLSRGDATLTRRASQSSSLRAVVVRFSKTRERYERQGILIEEAALKKAQDECLADAQVRSQQRERNAQRRERLEAEYVAQFAQKIQSQYPFCPPEQATVIAKRACQKHSGRVGRTAAAKEFNPEALKLAVVAYIRHNYTNYDELLRLDWERHEARNQVASQVQKILERWCRETNKLK